MSEWTARRVLIELYKICANRALNKPVIMTLEFMKILEKVGITDINMVCEKMSKNRKFKKHLYYLLLKHLGK